MPAISNLPAVTTFTGTMLFPVVDVDVTPDTTKRATFSQLRDYILGYVSVFSVAGKNGDVVLDWGDIGGLAAISTSSSYNDLVDLPNPYVLTSATSVTLGGVKIGSGISITGDGTISVTPYTLTSATSSVLGGVRIGSGISITGNGTISTVPMTTATGSVLGGVKVGANISVTADGTISVASLNTATASVVGGVKVGSGLSITGAGVLSANATTTTTTLRITDAVSTNSLHVSGGAAIVGDLNVIGNIRTASTSIALGLLAGSDIITEENTQGIGSIAIGERAGTNGQGDYAVAIGNSDTGWEQGNYSIAIGYQAGFGDFSGIGENTIAIGALAAYGKAAANSIILNATSTDLSTDNEGFFVSPVRNQPATTTVVYYNSSTKEVTYGSAVSALTVKEEGTNITTAATSINFAGATVTATDVDGNVTVTIAGGGAAFDGGIVTSSTQFTNITESTSTSTGAVTIAGGLGVGGNVNVGSTLTTKSLEINGASTPRVYSASNLNLEAVGRVQVTQSPFKIWNVTETERDAIAASNGDLIYNTDTHKFQGYANGSWVDIS